MAEQHQSDSLLLAYALKITGDPTEAIESAVRAGNIAEALRPYSSESKAEMLKAIISASQKLR
jgi:hypothetical protein